MNPNLLRLLTWFKSATKWLLPLGILLMSIAGARGQTVTGTYGGILVYSASNNQVTIKGFTSSLSGTVTIPDTINVSGSDLSVTSIGSIAFQNCSALTSVTIPSSVTNIGSGAFYRCSKLVSIRESLI